MAEVDNVKKFLDFLGRAEGAEYNTIVGGNTFSDFTRHPSIIGMRTKEGPSTAAGKYQITKTTYNDFAKKVGVSDFSPESQDKVALAIIQQEGALDDVRTGNFRAAIDKLGGRWASLPSSKYSQPKRGWDWAEKELSMPGGPVGQPGPSLQFQAADPSGIAPTQSIGQPKLLMADLQKEAQYGGAWNTLTQTPTAIEYGFKNENNAYNWLTEQGSKQFDPNFVMTKEKLQAAAKDRPEDYKPYLAAAGSDDDLARRVARLDEALVRQKEMGNMGAGMSFMGSVVGSVLDVDSLLAAIPAAGTVAAANKVGRLGRSVRAGLAAGATNAGAEYLFGDSRPTQESNDVYLAGLFGLTLGGAAGALTSGRKANPDFDLQAKEFSEWAQKEANKVQVKELEDNGLTLTENGKSLFTPTTPLTQKFSEADLANVGLGLNPDGTPVRSKANLKAADSIDVPEAGYKDMKALKATPSIGPNIDQARVSIAKAFGGDIMEGLEASGRIKFLNSQDDLPLSLKDPRGVNAFYDPIMDTTFLMADRINEKNARGIIMHDVGVHQGLERIVGTPLYTRMIAEVDGLAAKGDAAAKRALERAEKSPTKDFLKAEEKLAYYMEAVGDKAQGIFREFLAQVKAFLIKRFGFDMQLNQKDLIAIVQGSVRRVATDKKFGSYSENFPYVWHGGPVKGLDKLRTSFIGAGEGNVHQGWGVYTTSSKFIGNWYRTKESMLRGMEGEDGGLYQLKVNNASPEQFLRWDSASQSKEVQKALKKAGIDIDGKQGREIYFDIMAKMEGETPLAKAKGASELLDSLGIRGNVYTTGSTRKNSVKSDNYVFFNDRHLDVSARYSVGEDVDPDLLPPKDANGNTPEGFYQGPAYENFFNRSWVPNEVKSFVRSIFGSTTGYKDHSVVSSAASDQKRALYGQWQNQFAKTLQPAINDFFERNPVPFMKKSEAMEQWNEQLSDYIRGIPGDYDPSIVKVGNEWRRLSKDVVDHINNPGKFSGDSKQGLTQREIVDAETGEKRLSDPLDYNETYLPRLPDTYKIGTTIAQFGRETVERYIGNMFKSANANISDELAGKLGKWYLRTVEEAKVNRASELVDNMLRGFDRVSFKDSLIKIGGINPNDADRIIASMGKPSKGSDVGAFNGSLKRRSILDESYTEKILLKDGTTSEMSYRDLFDTDTVGLINQYFNKQAGAVSFSNNTGIYSIQGAKQIIAELTERGFGSKVTDEQLSKMRKHLEDIVDMHLGRPLEDFTTMNKSLQMVADYNILTKAGMFVLNQITEMSQLLGSSMRRSVLRAVPEMGSLIRDTKTGKVSNEVIDALENLSGGPGTILLHHNPLSPSRVWTREKGDTPFNRWLDKGDTLLKAGTHNLFKYTGMTGVTMMQQRLMAVAMVNHFVDHAVNGKKLNISSDRLAWMGLGPEDAKAVMAGISQYHKTGKGRLGEVDFTRWSQDDPKTFSKFIVAYQRESARVIQDNDLASMVPVMGKQIGKTVFQFMGFPLQAWNKSMLFAVNHRDMQTLNTVMWAIGFNMLMYTARTQVQMANMSAEEKMDFAEKRLSTSQIMLNAVGRIPQLSVLPNLFDTVSPVPLFSGMRTTTDLTDFVSGNPTLSTISSALTSTKKLARNTGSEEYQTTEKDVKALFRLLPLNNVIGASAIINSVSSEFPSRELVDE